MAGHHLLQHLAYFMMVAGAIVFVIMAGWFLFGSSILEALSQSEKRCISEGERYRRQPKRCCCDCSCGKKKDVPNRQ